MNKIFTLVFVLLLTCTVSCEKNKSDLTEKVLTYEKSEMLNKLYMMDKIRSKTHKLKSFADEDREL